MENDVFALSAALQLAAPPGSAAGSRWHTHAGACTCTPGPLLVPFVPAVRGRLARALYTSGVRARARCLPLPARTHTPRRSSRERPAGGDGVAG